VEIAVESMFSMNRAVAMMSGRRRCGLTGLLDSSGP
jgi:hypothetical protein